MKKLMMELFLFIPLIIFAEVIDLPAGITSTEILHSNYSSIQLKAEFDMLEIGERSEGIEIFSTLIIPNTHSTVETGYPMIPVIRRIVEIPYGASVRLEAVSSGEREIFLSRRIYPVQPSTIKEPGVPEIFEIDNSAYKTGKSYGEELVKIIDDGYIRGHHYITLEIYPLGYNPSEGICTLRENIDINIVLEGSNIAETQRSYSRYYSKSFESFLNNSVLNAFAYGDQKYPTLPTGYLIITPDSYVGYLDDFIEWKKLKGYHVTVATLTQTGSSNTQIKAYIQDAYDNWDIPPQFVLLIGDDDMPAYNGQETSSITDHPYGQLDGTDLFHDVWLGRWPISSSTELQTIIDKTMTFEHPDLWTNGEAWCKKAVFMASSHNHNISEGSHRWVIQTYLGPAGFACDTLWNYSGATTAQVSSAYNDGRSFGVFSGHGSTTSWADGPQFTQSNVNALTNNDMYPIVQSYACLTGKWSVTECFGETWIRADNKASVSFWSSSPSSYWTEDDSLERWVFQGMFDSSLTWQRAFLDYGLLGVYYNGTRVQYYYEAYNLFGDPSIDAWTDYPQDLNVTYPGAIPIGNIDVQVNVNTSKATVENALVSITDDDSIWIDYTDAGGVANIMVSTTQAGSLFVTVTGHNLEPHYGIIHLTSNNAYVSYLFTNPIGGHSNGQINASCTYDLEVYVKNWGSQTAHNVNGLLVSSDTNITINQDSVNYGDINAGDSTSGASYFNASLTDNIPDGYSIPMELTLAATESTWVSNFSLIVNAPVLSLWTMMGPAEVLPGDNFYMWPKLENEGSGTAYNLDLIVRTDDSYGSVTDSTENMSSILSGDISWHDSAFHVSISASTPEPYFMDFELEVQMSGGYSYFDTITVGIGSVVFSEDFESGGTGWTYTGSTSWHLTEHDSHSATHSMYCGQEGTWEYMSDLTNSRTVSPQFTVGAGAVMTFWHRYDIEESWDGAQMQLTTNGGSTWTTIDPDEGYTGASNYGYGGYNAGDPFWTGQGHTVWEEQHHTFTTSGDVNVCWRFGTDGSVVEEGYYFDDILVGVQSGFSGVEEELTGPIAPTGYQFALHRAYPNPVRGRAMISYSVGSEVPVRLIIYDVTGREVSTLVDQVQTVGNYKIEWDGRDNHGIMVSSGTYFYRMTAGGFSAGEKLVVVR